MDHALLLLMSVRTPLLPFPTIPTLLLTHYIVLNPLNLLIPITLYHLTDPGIHPNLGIFVTTIPVMQMTKTRRTMEVASWAEQPILQTPPRTYLAHCGMVRTQIRKEQDQGGSRASHITRVFNSHHSFVMVIRDPHLFFQIKLLFRIRQIIKSFLFCAFMTISGQWQMYDTVLAICIDATNLIAIYLWLRLNCRNSRDVRDLQPVHVSLAFVHLPS